MTDPMTAMTSAELEEIKKRVEMATIDSRMVVPGTERYRERQKAINSLILHAAHDESRLLQEVSRLTAALDAEKKRAEAAVADLNLAWDCGTCARHKINGGECAGEGRCTIWKTGNKPPQYVWRGPCACNTKGASHADDNH
jgi:hypothetical protein